MSFLTEEFQKAIDHLFSMILAVFDLVLKCGILEGYRSSIFADFGCFRSLLTGEFHKAIGYLFSLILAVFCLF